MLGVRHHTFCIVLLTRQSLSWALHGCSIALKANDDVIPTMLIVTAQLSEKDRHCGTRVLNEVNSAVKSRMKCKSCCKNMRIIHCYNYIEKGSIVTF